MVGNTGDRVAVEPYTVRALDASTWGAFAELVERNNGVFGGCGCRRSDRPSVRRVE